LDTLLARGRYEPVLQGAALLKLAMHRAYHQHQPAFLGMGDRALPRVNRLIHNREVEHLQSIHKSTMKAVRPAIDNGAPKVHSHLVNQSKKKQMQLGTPKPHTHTHTSTLNTMYLYLLLFVYLPVCIISITVFVSCVPLEALTNCPLCRTYGKDRAGELVLAEEDEKVQQLTPCLCGT
jgi:hypothetical protein